MAVPGARVAFMRPEYESGTLRQNILAEFAAHGVPEDRIEFWSEPSEKRAHMLRYNEVDLLLDCYPMTGGIGMLEALHMGVPAVSLEGPAIQLRVGASHLHAVGLDDLRALSVADYAALVGRLAADSARRRGLRHSLRPTLAQTSFVDVERFGREFNDALVGLLDHPALRHDAHHGSQEGKAMAEAQGAGSVTIDGKSYPIDSLSEAARQQLQNIQMADNEIKHLKARLSLAQTARSAYLEALKAELD